MGKGETDRELLIGFNRITGLIIFVNIVERTIFSCSR